jgi:hypothetical protein
MREEPNSTPLPEKIEPSSYHLDCLVEERKELALLMEMTDEQIQVRIDEEHDKNLQNNQERIKECDVLREKYETMLKQVREWVPPTPDHIGLQNTMKNQIRESISHDCDTDYYEKRDIKCGPKNWRKVHIQATKRVIEYHEKGHEAEVLQARTQTRWIRQLRVSLE